MFIILPKNRCAKLTEEQLLNCGLRDRAEFVSDTAISFTGGIDGIIVHGNPPI
jgi:hypothetical protein